MTPENTPIANQVSVLDSLMPPQNGLTPSITYGTCAHCLHFFSFHRLCSRRRANDRPQS
jgi:hypothetical protein